MMLNTLTMMMIMFEMNQKMRVRIMVTAKGAMPIYGDDGADDGVYGDGDGHGDGNEDGDSLGFPPPSKGLGARLQSGPLTSIKPV